jgi:hypothetical protein
MKQLLIFIMRVCDGAFKSVYIFSLSFLYIKVLFSEILFFVTSHFHFAAKRYCTDLLNGAIFTHFRFR